MQESEKKKMREKTKVKRLRCSPFEKEMYDEQWVEAGFDSFSSYVRHLLRQDAKRLARGEECD